MWRANVALRRALVKSDGAGAYLLLRSVSPLLVRLPHAFETAVGAIRDPGADMEKGEPA